jgi:signal transduction histidine kinase/CheY-like chemotaxis protein
MKLRSHLFILALGTIVPVAIFAVVVAVWLVDRERDAQRVGAEQQTFALLTAVDARLRGHLTTLEALASVPSLQEGNLEYFREVAENALKSQPNWLNIRVAAPDGASLMNLRVADGEWPHGMITGDDSFQRAARSGKPAVSNIAWDPYLVRWRFTVRAPVLRAGSIIYVVAADVSPETVASLLEAQRLEPNWLAVVLDANNRFVARTQAAETFIGQPASASLQGALAQSTSGWFRGRTVEGLEVYSPFHRSAATGWTVSLGITAPTFDSAAWRSGWTLAFGMGLSIVLALLGAHLINRRIARPITSLAALTEAITKGERTEVSDDGRVDEIRILARALRESAQAAHERQALIEREKISLVEADRAKDRFLAMLGHELRNPLAAISAAAHVVRFAKPGSADAIKAQLVIDRQTRHMTHLVGDLLDISRVTLGKMALEREPLDIGRVVNELVRSWRTSGRFERHVVRLDVRSAWVNADRTRVEQILTNLLENALKFTPQRKAVTVELTQEGNEAVLCVADEGPGIPQKVLDRLFEPFVQGNEPGTKASAGLGLGLALVKGLVEMHGGSVSVSSGASGGAVFTVRFPTIEAPSAQHAVPAAGLGGRHILLIEDDDDTRTMLHAALEFGGHEVREARDGTSGLALAAEAPPDVAVIDIGLPDIDGLEVARRLRSAQGKRRLSLVALTGFGGPEDQRRALDAGFDVHLTKPVTHERLKRVIGELT